ncbi:MAG: imidazolonepropionase [Chloroflexi bacterium]|nr:imidazolonepropionase [Chloroflexota bacterium]
MTGPPSGDLGTIDGPWIILVTDGVVVEVRPGGLRPGDPESVTDVGAALCTPGLVDPHTHLVFGGDRSDEAAARARGERYTGGGILRTVAATEATPDDVLRDGLRGRLGRAMATGTTTIEVKSGYGLTAAAEIRLLRLIGEAAAPLPLRVARTYLGAHAVPPGMTPASQAQAVIDALPQVASLADHIDVFCEPDLFDVSLARSILLAGRAHGLGLRIHADQLRRSGALSLGVELGARSVDHLEQATADDARLLADSGTVATVLPGPALLLRGGLPPVRALFDAGATVALGSDANAGTFGEPSMPLAIGLGVMIGCSVEEAWWAATRGAAASLGLADTVGCLGPGMAADIVAWDVEHEGAAAMRPGAIRPVRAWFAGRPRSD